ncbi:hypothetical protein [Anaeromyxobacter oryzae]|uniref:Zinc-regulated TonB-dependent outer membrane receptor n=1 Tax=Anaeromyxobacter oryzae TaxID=2918170 RepID=A0ABM7WQ14_9BACT|nr:hypothetical protein [Anaeromyxobacter oryzae]BDG01561.1 hypothetical protein AMOR_05570 [Anaeromyxobacter oryzae]
MRTVLAASVLAALSASWPARGQDPGAGGSAPPQQQPQSTSQSASQSQSSPQSQSTPQSPSQPPAQPQSDEEKRKLEEQIAKELGATPPAQPAAPAATPGAAPDQGGTAPAGQGPQGGSPYARLLLMPDLSAIGSFGAALDGYDVATRSPRPEAFGPKGTPHFYFQELELGLQAVVDPYVRADAFLSFNPDGVDVEEAYATTLSLPAGLQVRAGKFFSPFGRQNQQHPHVLEFVDMPLVRSRLLAEDVLSGPGVDVAWLAPLPWYAELHLAAQDTAPYGEKEGGLTGAARLLQYFPFGDAATLGVGVSAARRGEGTGGAFRDLGGADAYLRVRPLQSRSYLALQGEVYARKYRDVPGQDSATRTGWWAQAFWRQDAWWGWGVRYEQAPAGVPDTPGATAAGIEQRVSAVGAWLPSEFQRIRLQLAWDRPPGGGGGPEVLLHFEFGIGAHGAHPF